MNNINYSEDWTETKASAMGEKSSSASNHVIMFLVHFQFPKLSYNYPCRIFQLKRKKIIVVAGMYNALYSVCI